MSKNKLIGIGITGTVLGLLLAWAITRSAFATNTPKVDICHCNENHCETLNIATIAAIAHLKQHENDYKGQCEGQEPVTHLTCVEYACVEVEGEGENSCTTSEDCAPYEEQDVCTNLEGNQEVTPEGYVNNDGYCYIPEEEEEEEPKRDEPKTYSEDTRCHARKPADATWVEVDTQTPNDNKILLTWALEGADKVEIKFGDDTSGDYLKWAFITSNDGHEEIGNLANGIHHWFSVRGINDCRTGDWSTPIDPLP